MIVKELHTIAEMLPHLSVLQHLYPELNLENYENMLKEMLKNSYGQVAVFEGETCLAISGFWLGTKLWCGKYLELDNVIVHPEHRNKGIGKIISNYLEEKARKMNCTILALDAYTTNFKAHRFYYNQGFGPKGFHFIKVLNKEGLS